jgi:hypothetical protein
MGLINEFIACFLKFFMIVKLLSLSTIQNQYDPTLTYNNVLATMTLLKYYVHKDMIDSINHMEWISKQRGSETFLSF